MSKIKICGLSRECDIDFVNMALPDYIGFVFAKSPRQVSFDTARKLKSKLDKSIKSVGVFVNESAENIKKIADSKTIDVIQLHGDEDDEFIKKIKSLCGLPIIKAVRVESTEDILAWDSSSADYLLLDNGKGGTGKAFDHSLICKTKKPIFLAGGISADNIEQALEYSPYCIDVSSGAETNGVKDELKIKALVEKVR